MLVLRRLPLLVLLMILRHRWHRRPVFRLRFIEVLLVEGTDAVRSVLGVLRVHDLIWRQRAEANRQTAVVLLRNAQTALADRVLLLKQMRGPLHVPAPRLLGVKVPSAVGGRRRALIARHFRYFGKVEVIVIQRLRLLDDWRRG
jgi:hypothetical protein